MVKLTDLTFTTMSKTGEEKETNVLEYFKQAHNITLTARSQPVFICKFAGKEMHIPSEACSFEGIPNDLKRNPMAMREVFKNCLIEPRERINRSVGMAKQLMDSGSFGQFGFEVDTTPTEVEAKILPLPLFSKTGAVCDERSLRSLKVENYADFSSYNWTMAYHAQNCFEAADNLCRNMIKASNGVGIKNFQEPSEWLEYNKEGDIRELEQRFTSLFGTDPKTWPKMVLFVLKFEDKYPPMKKFFEAKGIPSQCVKMGTAMKDSLSIASNILKQMNPKMGFNNYALQMPDGVSKKMMLIGIDVTHKPKKSIVGVVGSYDEGCMKYTSEYVIQDKGQEIVHNLKNPLKNLFTSFQNHRSCLPDHIVVYRDGVGDSMRNTIMETEIGQLDEIVGEIYNNMSHPKITVVVVNKRISQKFFANGQNPEPGTVIDKKVVNKESAAISYDFYAVSQNTTQGCVTPTHYFVQFDDSGMPKQVLEQLTYNLAYGYQNWAGSIKVPAPCQYAHKVAEYYLQTQKVGARTKNTGHEAQEISPIQNLLHFL
jgi:aubergine-like protein